MIPEIASQTDLESLVQKTACIEISTENTQNEHESRAANVWTKNGKEKNLTRFTASKNEKTSPEFEQSWPTPQNASQEEHKPNFKRQPSLIGKPEKWVPIAANIQHPPLPFQKQTFLENAKPKKSFGNKSSNTMVRETSNPKIKSFNHNDKSGKQSQKIENTNPSSRKNLKEDKFVKQPYVKLQRQLGQDYDGNLFRSRSTSKRDIHNIRMERSKSDMNYKPAMEKYAPSMRATLGRRNCSLNSLDNNNEAKYTAPVSYVRIAYPSIQTPEIWPRQDTTFGSYYDHTLNSADTYVERNNESQLKSNVYFEDIGYNAYLQDAVIQPDTIPKDHHDYVIAQIEYYFSIENLCKDIYLRKQMGSDGFVPLSLLANFNRIKSLDIALDTLKNICVASEICEVLAADEHHSGQHVIRRRKDWPKWILIPTAQPSGTTHT